MDAFRRDVPRDVLKMGYAESTGPGVSSVLISLLLQGALEGSSLCDYCIVHVCPDHHDGMSNGCAGTVGDLLMGFVRDARMLGRDLGKIQDLR